MKVRIVGIRGYLGQIVSEELISNGHKVSGIKRQLLYGDNKLLQKEISGCDVLINIAGAPILQAWTEKNKEKIYNSRVRVTQHIVKAINALPLGQRPKRFIQTSAVGIYRSGETHSELSQDFANTFLGKLAVDWEAALDTLHYSVEKTVFRLGLVLGARSTIIKRLAPIFKLGLGARIASGKQAFPFVHERDISRAFLVASEGKLAPSKYNLVAPHQIDNSAFTQAMAKQLGKKAIFSVPAFALRLQLGKAAQLLLESPQVEAEKIQEAGFEFLYPNIDSALHEVLTPTKMIAVTK